MLEPAGHEGWEYLDGTATRADRVLPDGRRHGGDAGGRGGAAGRKHPRRRGQRISAHRQPRRPRSLAGLTWSWSMWRLWPGRWASDPRQRWLARVAPSTVETAERGRWVMRLAASAAMAIG